MNLVLTVSRSEAEGSERNSATLRSMTVIFVSGMFGVGGSITISVIGEKDPIVLYRNPQSSTVDSDLYTWLVQKGLTKSET